MHPTEVSAEEVKAAQRTAMIRIGVVEVIREITVEVPGRRCRPARTPSARSARAGGMRDRYGQVLTMKAPVLADGSLGDFRGVAGRNGSLRTGHPHIIAIAVVRREDHAASWAGAWFDEDRARYDDAQAWLPPRRCWPATSPRAVTEEATAGTASADASTSIPPSSRSSPTRMSRPPSSGSSARTSTCSAHLIALPSGPALTIRISERHGWHHGMYDVTADLGFPNTPRMAIKAAHYLTPVTPDCGLTMFLPGSQRLTEEPVVPAGAIDPPGAIAPDIAGTDAVLFENRTWHTGGINLSGRPRIALMLQYGYRWLHPIDDPVTHLQRDPDLTPVERQLLGLPDSRPDGALAKGSGAAPIRSWWENAGGRVGNSLPWASSCKSSTVAATRNWRPRANTSPEYPFPDLEPPRTTRLPRGFRPLGGGVLAQRRPTRTRAHAPAPEFT